MRYVYSESGVVYLYSDHGGQPVKSEPWTGCYIGDEKDDIPMLCYGEVKLRIHSGHDGNASVEPNLECRCDDISSEHAKVIVMARRLIKLEISQQ